ncbi:MAG: CHASE3 domain-containing protein [Myxococcaceae bacterium]
MNRNWTYGSRLAFGFTLAGVVLLVVSLTGYRSNQRLIENDRLVSHTHQVRRQLAWLLARVVDAETGERGFVITGDEVYLEPYQAAVGDIDKTFDEVRRLTSDNPSQQQRLAAMRPAIDAELVVLREVIAARRASGADAASAQIVKGASKQHVDEVRKVVAEMDEAEASLLQLRAAEAEASADLTRSVILFGSVFGVLLVALTGWVISRALSRQIGSSVQRIQSSSAELQAAANQQVTSAKEQSGAMNEISTTITELLATSRQISESAQRVAKIAEQTAGSARTGDGTLNKAAESIESIKRQVEQIVSHMLELGKKSQQIGVVLDIVQELAEQTNILAINATIEAAGAGESGKRFAVVADEIRKLADRVSLSTKEIRALIDDVRGAVNTTVMATETGAKTVDSGSRLFSEVAVAFKQISSQVIVTTEAAKEIELSTKQQTSAVEQVNMAIANVAQATRETEASSSQTLQTASQLATLSGELQKMVQAGA